MKKLFDDLWQTTPEHPLSEFPEIISHAYVLVRDEGNIMFYSTGREAIDPVSDEDDLEYIRNLGGIRRQYLGHWHEATPALARIKQTFKSDLCCHTLEDEAIHKASGVHADLTFHDHEMHLGAIEVIPSPGHTKGSACYRYQSPYGKTYLFTGDTLMINDDGVWNNGYLPGGESDKTDLKETLEMLRELKPDVVFFAASNDRFPFKEVTNEEWKAAIDEAIYPLKKETS
jgi:glyoxylase-like metal-dependent hydrolase (beta-lactamase superfamily II)